MCLNVAPLFCAFMKICGQSYFIDPSINRLLQCVIRNCTCHKGEHCIEQHCLHSEQTPALFSDSRDDVQQKKARIMPNICIICDFSQCADALMIKQLCQRLATEQNNQRGIEYKCHEIVDAVGDPFIFVHHQA